MVSKYFAAFFMTILISAVVNVGCGQSISRTYVYGSHHKQGWLGVEVQEVTQRLKEKKHLDVAEGAYVTNVIEDSPAEQSGIEKGDVIVKFDGKNIEDSDDLINAVRRVKPKTEVKIDIVRKTDRKTVSAILGRTPTPQAFSFKFDDKNIPPVPPRMPFRLRMFSSEEFYGMQIQPITKQLGEYFDVPNGKGVLVAEVKKGSSAEKAGFKAGDVIIRIDNNAVRDIDDLREELSDNREKETPFEVMRKGKSLTLTMKLEEEDENDDDDDYSNSIIIPHERHHLNMFRMELPHVDHMELNHLKEDMKEFGKRLKDKIQYLKETLREELREL